MACKNEHKYESYCNSEKITFGAGFKQPQTRTVAIFAKSISVIAISLVEM